MGCYGTTKYRNKRKDIYKIKRNEEARIRKRKELGIDVTTPLYKTRTSSEYKNKDGYIILSRRGHNSSRKNGAISQHRFIMSEHLKTPLKIYETVHHKNGIKDDNRVENLELWHRGQPAGQRLEDKIKWAIEFLEEYGYKFIK
jgi:hypothetical protein